MGMKMSEEYGMPDKRLREIRLMITAKRSRRIYRHIGKKIRIAAILRGITIKEICRRVGFSRAFLHEVENGIRGMPDKRLDQLSEILDVSKEWLISNDGLQKIYEVISQSPAT